MLAADGNFASSMVYLKDCANCEKWDKSSTHLQSRPFSPVNGSRPYHSRTVLDYAVAASSDLVTQHGFKGGFNVEDIGVTSDFRFFPPPASQPPPSSSLSSRSHDAAYPWLKSAIRCRTDAFGVIQGERYV